MDARKIYVGNLSFKVGSEDLESHFAQFGVVEEAFIVMDREVCLLSLYVAACLIVLCCMLLCSGWDSFLCVVAHVRFRVSTEWFPPVH